MSARLSAQNNTAPTRRIFMKFDLSALIENLSRKLKLHENLTRIMDNLHEDAFTFMTIPRWIPKIRHFSNKHCKQNQNAHFMYSTYITKCDVIQIFSFSTRDKQFHILFNVTSVTTTYHTTLLTYICGRSPDRVLSTHNAAFYLSTRPAPRLIYSLCTIFPGLCLCGWAPYWNSATLAILSGQHERFVSYVLGQMHTYLDIGDVSTHCTTWGWIYKLQDYTSCISDRMYFLTVVQDGSVGTVNSYGLDDIKEPGELWQSGLRQGSATDR